VLLFFSKHYSLAVILLGITPRKAHPHQSIQFGPVYLIVTAFIQIGTKKSAFLD